MVFNILINNNLKNPSMSDDRFLHRSGFGRTMAPIWPFGKKKEPDQLEEEAPAPIIYKMGENASQRTLADESHKSSNDYKSALALFGGGETEVTKAADQSTQYDGIVSGDGQQSSDSPAPAVNKQTLPEISARTETPKQVKSSPPAIPTRPAVPTKATPPAVPTKATPPAVPTKAAPPAIPTKPAVPSKAAPPAVPQTPAFTWIHHTDGYHYKKKADGSFDATPHVKNNNGSYIPYS